MQVMDLRDILEKAETKDRISCLIRALRADEKIWSFLTQSTAEQENQIVQLAGNKKLNPGMLGLLSINEEWVVSGYPDCRLQVSVLENCMVNYESFFQQHNPTVSLEEAAKLAVVLVEKRKISPTWAAILLEVVNRKHISDGEQFNQQWGTSLAIAINLVNDQDAFLADLLKLHTPDLGIPALIHCLLCLPVSEEEKTQKLVSAGVEGSAELTEKICEYLISVGEGELAERTAQICLPKILNPDARQPSTEEILDATEKALSHSMEYKQVASVAQIAGDKDTASDMLDRSLRILDAISTGMKIQTLSLKNDRLSGAKNLKPDQINDAVLLREFASLGYLPDTHDETAVKSHPLTLLQEAKKIGAAGNAELARIEMKKAFSGMEDDQTGTLLDFQPHFNPTWNQEDVVSALSDMGADTEAARVAKKLVSKNPASLSANRLAAKALLKIGNYSEALPLLETLSSAGDQSLESNRTLADCYQRLGINEACYKIRKQIVEDANAGVKDQLQFAEAAVKINKPEEVFKATAKILENDQDNATALSLNGSAYYLIGNQQKALDSFSKAIEMGTDSPDPWLGLANLYNNERNYRLEIETLRKGLSTMPANIAIKRQLAATLMETGSAAEALPLLNDLAECVKDVEVRILQAEAMKTLGLEEYRDLIHELYARYPENSEIAQAQAAELIKEGKRDEAKAVLQEQIADAQPGDQANLLYADAILGIDYEQFAELKTISARESERVKTIIDACLENDPENSRAQLLNAELLAHKGQHSQAFEIFSKLSKEQGSIDKSLTERIQVGFAQTAAFLGKFELAVAAIKQAVDAKPQWVGLRKVMAQIYAFAGELNEAMTQAEQVLEICPQIVDGIAWFVDFLNGLGQAEEAEKRLRIVLEERPSNLALQAKLAEILVKNGKEADAKGIAEVIKSTLSNDLSDEELRKTAQVFEDLGDTESVLDCLQNRVSKDGTLDAILDLAGYQVQLEQFDKALESLSRGTNADGESRLVTCLKADVLNRIGSQEPALELLTCEYQHGFEDCEEVDQSFMPDSWKSLLNSNAPEWQLKANIYFSMGKPAQCLESTRQWIELDPEDAAARIMAVESLKALGESVEPELFAITQSETGSNFLQAHLTALKIESLLDQEQLIEAQQLFEKSQEVDSSSIQSVGIRFAMLAGHLAEAETCFDELYAARQKINLAELPIRIGLSRLIIAGASALRRWNEALSMASGAATSYGWHLGGVLQYLVILVKAAEFEPVAKLLAVDAHDPSGFLQQVKIEDELNWLIGLTGGKFEETEKRWFLRGKMAATPVAENIRAFALVTPSPDDAAAMVAALHASGQDSTAVQVAKKFPDDAAVLFELARIQAEDDLNSALETLNTLISIDPLDPVALALRSSVHDKMEKIDLAINDLEQAISDWPNETCWRLNVAEMWQRYGNNTNAVNQLKTAFDANPEDEKIALALSNACIDNSDYEDAIHILTPLTKRNPNLFEAWEVMAEAHSGLDEMDQALEAAKKASHINPFSTKPYLMSGKIHLEHGNTDKALEQAKQAVSQNKKDADAVLFLAKVHNERGEKQQALAALEMTHKCQNVTVQTMIDHVNLIRQINGTASAKELIASLSTRYPENVELMKLLASAQVENGDKMDAEETAKRALQVDPDEPDLHLFLGKINAESGQLDQAIHHLSQGIAHKNSNSEGYLLLSKVYEQQREFTKAIDTLNQAMEAVPQDTRSYVAAANLYKDSKNYSAAEKVLQKAVDIDPKDVTIRRQLGALLALKLVHHSQEASSQS